MCNLKGAIIVPCLFIKLLTKTVMLFQKWTQREDHFCCFVRMRVHIVEKFVKKQDLLTCFFVIHLV